jgi:signal transduction histidine kinase
MVGNKMTEAPGLDGRAIHAKTTAAHAAGGGWVDYELKNPVTGKTEPKMSYIMPLGELSVGCGVYRTELMIDDAA